jgi:hypothetical protein
MICSVVADTSPPEVDGLVRIEGVPGEWIVLGAVAVERSDKHTENDPGFNLIVTDMASDREGSRGGIS